MKKNRRPTSRRTNLQFEQLESRLPLAGDVVVKVSGSNLTITGDAQPNDISIALVGSDWVVTGNDGENVTFNGATAGAANVPVPANGFAKVTINMGFADTDADHKNGNEGADKVTLDGPLAMSKNLSITGKNGGDVNIDGINVGGVTSISFKNGKLTGGDGSRVIATNSTFAKKVSVTTGKDDDLVILDNLGITSGGLSINTKEGDSDVQVINSNITGAVAITGGANTDVAVISDTLISTNLTVKAGAGDNTLAVLGQRTDVGANFDATTKIGGKFSYSSKLLGADNVGFLGAVIGGALSVSTGTGGNDFVGAADLVVKGKTTVTTGAGDDVVAIGLQDGNGDPLPPGGLGNVLLGNVTVSTKAGADLVAAQGTEFGVVGDKKQGRVTILLGDGDDRLAEDLNTFNIPGTLFTAAGAETAISSSRAGKGTDSLLSSLSPVGEFILDRLQFEDENIAIQDVIDDIFARVEPAFDDILFDFQGIDITP